MARKAPDVDSNNPFGITKLNYATAKAPHTFKFDQMCLNIQTFYIVDKHYYVSMQQTEISYLSTSSLQMTSHITMKLIAFKKITAV